MIGITLACNIMVAAGLTGACLNPAVGLMQGIFQYTLFKDGAETIEQFEFTTVYVFGPLVGGFLAGLMSAFNSSSQDAVENASSRVNKTQNYKPMSNELKDL